MSYIRICDACKSPIYADNYTSILVERPQDNDIPLIEIPYTDYNILNKNYILQKVGDL